MIWKDAPIYWLEHTVSMILPVEGDPLFSSVVCLKSQLLQVLQSYLVNGYLFYVTTIKEARETDTKRNNESRIETVMLLLNHIPKETALCLYVFAFRIMKIRKDPNGSQE